MKGLLYMKRKNIIIIGIAVVLAALSFGGFKYMQTLPQVDTDQAVENLEIYLSEVEDLYNELNEGFDAGSENADLESWQEFSSEWMVRANNIKPEVLEKRMEEKYGNFEAFITAANVDIIDLWKTYNRCLNAGEENRSSYEDRIYSQKESIEKKLGNIKEAIK